MLLARDNKAAYEELCHLSGNIKLVKSQTVVDDLVQDNFVKDCMKRRYIKLNKGCSGLLYLWNTQLRLKKFKFI
jgi:hypothetical protein